MDPGARRGAGGSPAAGCREGAGWASGARPGGPDAGGRRQRSGRRRNSASGWAPVTPACRNAEARPCGRRCGPKDLQGPKPRRALARPRRPFARTHVPVARARGGGRGWGAPRALPPPPNKSRPFLGRWDKEQKVGVGMRARGAHESRSALPRRGVREAGVPGQPPSPVPALGPTRAAPPQPQRQIRKEAPAPAAAGLAPEPRRRAGRPGGSDRIGSPAGSIVPRLFETHLGSRRGAPGTAGQGRPDRGRGRCLRGAGPRPGRRGGDAGVSAGACLPRLAAWRTRVGSRSVRPSSLRPAPPPPLKTSVWGALGSPRGSPGKARERNSSQGPQDSGGPSPTRGPWGPQPHPRTPGGPSPTSHPESFRPSPKLESDRCPAGRTHPHSPRWGFPSGLGHPGGRQGAPAESSGNTEFRAGLARWARNGQRVLGEAPGKFPRSLLGRAVLEPGLPHTQICLLSSLQPDLSPGTEPGTHLGFEG